MSNNEMFDGLVSGLLIGFGIIVLVALGVGIVIGKFVL